MVADEVQRKPSIWPRVAHYPFFFGILILTRARCIQTLSSPAVAANMVKAEAGDEAATVVEAMLKQVIVYVPPLCRVNFQPFRVNSLIMMNGWKGF